MFLNLNFLDRLLGERVGFESIFEMTTDDLPFALATVLTLSEDERQGLAFEFGWPFPSELDVQHVPFGKMLAMAKVVPVQTSPLNLDSIASMAATATATGIGAFAGFAIISGVSPLLLVTVPAGIIIFGAASGVAAGLREGLRDRIAKMIRGE